MKKLCGSVVVDIRNKTTARMVQSHPMKRTPHIRQSQTQESLYSNAHTLMEWYLSQANKTVESFTNRQNALLRPSEHRYHCPNRGWKGRGSRIYSFDKLDAKYSNASS